VTQTDVRDVAAGTAVPVIELVDVGKVYDTGALDVVALRDVTLRIDAGEFVAVTGPSGSGKSTLMHILGCLDVPTSGRYRLVGHDVGRLGEDRLAAVRNLFVGFVFQQFNLLPSMTALRNVELPLVYAGSEPAARRERARAALAEVGLEDRAEHRPGELSGGQQQRVAIARALVTDPAMILADEPTGNLDTRATEDVLHLLATLHDRGRTVVLITHEAELAAAAHRRVVVRDGCVVDDETGTTRRGAPPGTVGAGA
jgi:putative ABC transport system ATP-binding protein